MVCRDGREMADRPTGGKWYTGQTRGDRELREGAEETGRGWKRRERGGRDRVGRA